jgi:hypothetical protein
MGVRGGDGAEMTPADGSFFPGSKNREAAAAAALFLRKNAFHIISEDALW